MIPDWRYSPERLEERRFVLAALIQRGVVVDRKCYQFCHDFTSQGAATGLLENYKEWATPEQMFDAIHNEYLKYLEEVGIEEENKMIQTQEASE
jgi:hypothetical protein